MRTLSTLVAGALLSATVCAQGVITRQVNGESFFQYDGDIAAVLTAADASPGRDTIIFGGGQYEVPFATTLNITTPVVLVGSGVLEDSTLAYGGRTTLISANGVFLFSILAGADGTEMHGLTFGNGGVRMGNTPQSNVNNILISRCEIPTLALGGGNGTSLVDDVLIEQCIIGTLDLDRSTNPIVRNSVIQNLVEGAASSNAQLEHCMFFNFGLTGNIGNEYTNCIFIRNQSNAFTVNESQSILTNCLFVGQTGFSFSFGPNAIDGGGNQGVSPLNGTGNTTSAFPNLASTSYVAFDHGDNYTLRPIYQTIGQGGTQPGIYGGARPWKDGLLPFNPHWIELIAPNSTTVNGTLQGVQIKANAQQP